MIPDSRNPQLIANPKNQDAVSRSLHSQDNMNGSNRKMTSAPDEGSYASDETNVWSGSAKPDWRAFQTCSNVTLLCSTNNQMPPFNAPALFLCKLILPEQLLVVYISGCKLINSIKWWIGASINPFGLLSCTPMHNTLRHSFRLASKFILKMKNKKCVMLLIPVVLDFFNF